MPYLIATSTPTPRICPGGSPSTTGRDRTLASVAFLDHVASTNRLNNPLGNHN